MFGILIVDKPVGITSHDAVNTIRRRFHTKRVGHAGTLDPLASGVLVIAVGPATRFLQYLPLEPKVYEGVVRFGIETETMDQEGDVVKELPVPVDLHSRVQEALPSLTGLIDQLPPMYSAVKKNGKPLYEYARKGEVIERKPRRIHIEKLVADPIDSSDVRIEVTCSGGTYIRTLAHDLGQLVGCGAHLISLRRRAVGRFDLIQAKSLDEISQDDLVPLSDALKPMPLIHLSEVQTADVRMGRVITQDEFFEGHIGLIGPDGVVVGIADANGKNLQPECIIPAEATL